MGKTTIFAFAALSLLAPFTNAFEIRNPRPTHGPMGVTRLDKKFLPGDYLFISFDLEGLAFDPKTGTATYQTILKLYNAKNEEIFDKSTDNTVAAMLGGTRIPGDLHVIMGTKQDPGNYVVRLIVIDKLDGNKNTNLKFFDYRFELLPKDFGLVGVTAPAVGFPGQHYVASFALVNMKLDQKNNPNVDVVMRVLDDAGNVEMTKPISTFLPKDMPPPPKGPELNKENFIPMQFPIYLNRAGRFTVEIEATDRAANRKAKLRYKLNVIDIDSFIAR